LSFLYCIFDNAILGFFKFFIRDPKGFQEYIKQSPKMMKIKTEIVGKFFQSNLVAELNQLL